MKKKFATKMITIALLLTAAACATTDQPADVLPFEDHDAGRGAAGSAPLDQVDASNEQPKQEVPDAGAAGGAAGSAGGSPFPTAPVGGTGAAGAAGSAAAGSSGAAGGAAGAAGGAAGSAGSAGAAGGAAGSAGSSAPQARFCKVNQGERYAGQLLGCDSYTRSAFGFLSIRWQIDAQRSAGCSVWPMYTCAPGSVCTLFDSREGQPTQHGVCQ